MSKLKQRVRQATRAAPQLENVCARRQRLMDQLRLPGWAQQAVQLDRATVRRCRPGAQCHVPRLARRRRPRARQTIHLADEARMVVFDYLEAFYNPRRRHSALGYLSPVAYEQTCLPAAV